MHLAYLHYLYGDDTALNHVRQFTRAARALGHRIDVYAMNLVKPEPDESVPSSLLARTRKALKPVLSRYLHEPKELAWNVLYAFKELRLLARQRPDLLLVRSHLLTASSVPVSRRLGLPLIFELNAPAAESRLYLREYLHLPLIPETLEAWKLSKAHAITTVSSALKEHLVSRYGLPGGKITVVPNGADIDAFHPGLKVDSRLLETCRQGPIVGYVGSFQRWSGIDMLSGVMKTVGRLRPDVRFVFVGDGPEASLLRRSSSDLGDRVLFVGHVSHSRVPHLVAGFEIGILPEAAFYMSPLKVLEWMAAGKAVVAPAYGPLEELIDDGVHGLLFPPRDRSALTRAVLKLLDRPDLRKSLGRAAAARAASSLSWKDNAEKVMMTCAAALEQQDRRREGGA